MMLKSSLSYFCNFTTIVIVVLFSGLALGGQPSSSQSEVDDQSFVRLLESIVAELDQASDECEQIKGIASKYKIPVKIPNLTDSQYAKLKSVTDRLVQIKIKCNLSTYTHPSGSSDVATGDSVEGLPACCKSASQETINECKRSCPISTGSCFLFVLGCAAGDDNACCLSGWCGSNNSCINACCCSKCCGVCD